MKLDVEVAWRSERARLVARLARRFGDLNLAEDAVQDAFAVATATWHRTGVPERPGAWLWTVASRRAVDILRRTSTKEVLDLEAFAASLPEIHVDEPAVHGDPLSINDDLLGLVLACTHPAISAEGRIALTLRHVVGFHPREIAAAFLVAEAAMEKRLVRARAKLRASGVSLAIPPAERLQERCDTAPAARVARLDSWYRREHHGSHSGRDAQHHAIPRRQASSRLCWVIASPLSIRIDRTSRPTCEDRKPSLKARTLLPGDVGNAFQPAHSRVR